MNNLTDCVSRQAVIDLMMQKWGENFSGDDAMQESIDAIRLMPSVAPQEPRKSRDMEEIEEVINCDADAETKCKMISNILTAKPHYFGELQERSDKE